MIAGTKPKLQDKPQLNLKIDVYSIANGTNVSKLSWSAHIDNLCSSLSSKISLLCQLAYYVSVDVLKKFYQGYILPLIDYGSITWSGTTGANLKEY